MKIAIPVAILLAVVLGCRPPSATVPSQKQKPLPPTIEITKPRMSNEGNVYFLVSFQVRNTSDKPIEFLKTTASFYDKDGRFIRSEFMFVDRYTSLGPGQITPGKVQVDYDRRIKSYDLAFTARGDSGFSDTDVVVTDQVDKFK